MRTSSPEESIFHMAIQLSDKAAREAYLTGACGADTALRSRVSDLLAAYDAGDFLEYPATDLAAMALLPPIGEQPGDVIGPYKLLEQIGEGGMGLVFMAEQTQPLRRRVALKIIKPGLDTRAVIARFEAERQALALMDHPNIARVFDAGATESGRPYFVMELVRGQPITDYCRERSLSLGERLGLIMSVCDAVQHAHQKGVIHRDLKPTNIIVSQADTAPVPKVIDFGVAKATASQMLTDKTLFTAFSQLIGTPLYMSPEQADLGNQDVDTRSDVYSLGVVLYELLTGTTPFDADRLWSAGGEEMRRIIREEEPPKPSTRATTVAAGAAGALARGKKSPPQPSIAVSALRGDLDWIAMKSLEKDRRRRYESPSALAADLGRFLECEPVNARPPTYGDKLVKWSRRHRTLVAASCWSALAIAAISAGIISSSYRAVTLERNAARAAAEREREMARIAKTEQALSAAARLQAEKTLLMALEGFKPVGVAFGPDERLYVTTWGLNGVLRFDGSSGQFIDVFVASGSGGLNRPEAIAFGTDANDDDYPDLYVLNGDANCVLRFDGRTGEFLDTFVEPGSGRLRKPTGLAFGPDGNAYVTSFLTSAILRYDGRTGDFIDEFVSSGSGGLLRPQTPAFGPDGNLYVTSFDTSSVLRYDGQTGDFIDAFAVGEHDELSAPEGMAFAPDGTLYVEFRYKGVGCVARFDGKTGQFLQRLERPANVNEDGQTLLCGDNGLLYVCNFLDSTIHRYDLKNGRLQDVFVDRQTFLEALLLDYVSRFNLKVDNPSVIFRTAIIFCRQRDMDALEELFDHVTHIPENAALKSELAWELSTQPSADSRLARFALELATDACRLTDFRDANFVDTLAAAYARDGNFEQAIVYQRKAMELAGPKEIPGAVERLKCFQQEQPWPLEGPISERD
jgi:serine/threonine protein kinase/DNA-binding beta-propeller fold protein YncE